MSKNNEPQVSGVNLICEGTSIKGDIKASRDLRIDGYLNGKIELNSKLVVGTTGKVEGDIHCKTLDVSGKIDGNIFVSEMITLKATAFVTGNITTDKMSVEPGARFTGSCKMSEKGSPIKNEKK